MKRWMISAGFLFLILLLPASMEAKNKKEIFEYGLEAAGVGVEGTYLLKVWMYIPKVRYEREMLQRYAVRGVLFDGFSSALGTRNGSQGPLVTDVAIRKGQQVFFETLLEGDGGGYAKIMEGSVELLRISKKRYKVTALVSVRKDALREYLEKEGIIRGLSDGF